MEKLGLITNPARLRKRSFWGVSIYLVFTIFLLIYGKKAYGDFIGTIIIISFIGLGIVGGVINYRYYQKAKKGELASAKQEYYLFFGIIFLLIGIGFIIVEIWLMVFTRAIGKVFFQLNTLVDYLLGIIFIIAGISILRKRKLKRSK